ISRLAGQGPCVIVGRCADYILRDKADCLRVFIHADAQCTAVQRQVVVLGVAPFHVGVKAVVGSTAFVLVTQA
ncbi:cytidylate kinase family protein, partial [Gemmiger formicilis]|nr:cytidylate kinase family protein [Gemmiger formicilis]